MIVPEREPIYADSYDNDPFISDFNDYIPAEAKRKPEDGDREGERQKRSGSIPSPARQQHSAFGRTGPDSLAQDD